MADVVVGRVNARRGAGGRWLLCLCGVALSGCSGQNSTSDRPDRAAQSPGTIEQPASALVGTWDHRFNRADARVILQNFSGLVDDADTVAARFGFVEGGFWWLGFMFDDKLLLVGGVPEGDGGTYTVNRRQLAMTGSHGHAVVTYKWLLQGDELTLTALEECGRFANVTTHCKRDRSEMDPLMLLITDNTFQRSGDKATF